MEWEGFKISRQLMVAGGTFLVKPIIIHNEYILVEIFFKEVEILRTVKK